MRLSHSVTTIFNSMRARCDPRQRCGPPPKPQCLCSLPSITKSSPDIASLPSRLIAPIHSRTSAPSGSGDACDRHSTSGHAPHDRCRGFQPDHLFHEGRHAVWVLAKVIAQVGTAGQFEHCRADRGGNGVQSGEDEHERQSQRLGIGERIAAVQKLRKDSVAGSSALCVNSFGEVAEQLRCGNEVDLVGVAFQAEVDDGVFPRDQPVAVLER